MNKEFKVSGNIVDVKSRAVIKGCLVVSNGRIEKIIETESCDDSWIVPGFVNSHVHVESSMVGPVEFSRMAVKSGVVSALADPHEIANVLGVSGVEFMVKEGKKTPFKFYWGVPSCVPATNFETSGGKLGVNEIKKLINDDDFTFLAEMMNFPGVVYDDLEVAGKLEAAAKANKPIDGHAPGLKGEELKKYVQSGISTDHECVNLEDALEKINLGMKIQIREGSAAKDYNALSPLIEKYSDNLMFCTDDSHPKSSGDNMIIDVVRKSVELGYDVFNVLKIASVNPVEHYNLDVGLLNVGDKADFNIIDNLLDFKIQKTFIDGKLVFADEKTLIKPSDIVEDINNFNISPISLESISLSSINDVVTVNAIRVFDGDLFTMKKTVNLKAIDGKLVSDTQNDILKIVVVNRYKKNKPVVAFVTGFGIKSGAIASSVAHDSHNIVAVGVNDDDIVEAINVVIRNKGGISYKSAEVEKFLSLDIAGLMSSKSYDDVANDYNEINNAVLDTGSLLKAPFMTLSFMSLLVIPEIKIGDLGLFDGEKFEFMNLIEK